MLIKPTIHIIIRWYIKTVTFSTWNFLDNRFGSLALVMEWRIHKRGGWMHSLLIYLFICRSHIMAALLLFFHFAALYELQRWYQCWCYSVTFSIAFISLCSLWCNMLSANDFEAVGCRHEYTTTAFDISLGLFGSRLLWIETACT